MKHKIGIIGYRNHAQRLIDIIGELDDFEIVSVYHPTKSLQIQGATNNLQDLFANDAIIICSPNETHYDYIKKCLDGYSGYIFCEKPPVTNIDDCGYLNNLPNSNKERIYFNFSYRFSEYSKILKNYCEREDLGKIFNVNFVATHGLAFKETYKGSWRADSSENLHSITMTVAVHFIDLLSYYFGRPEEYSYYPSVVAKTGESYDTAILTLQYSEDVSASILVSYACPYKSEFEILSTNGMLRLSSDQLEILTPRDQFDDKGFFITPKQKETRVLNQEDDYESSLKGSMIFFLNHVRNKSSIPIHLFESSMISTKLLLDITSLEAVRE